MTTQDLISKSIATLQEFALSQENDQKKSLDSLIEPLKNIEIVVSQSFNPFKERQELDHILLLLLFHINGQNSQEIIEKICFILNKTGLAEFNVDILSKALLCNNHPIIKVALTLVDRNEGDILSKLLNQSPSFPVLSCIVSFLASESIELYQLVNSILVKLGKLCALNFHHQQQYDSMAFFTMLASEIRPIIDDSKKSLRAYSLISDLATISPEAYHSCEKAHLLTFATSFQVHQSSDILETIAMIELFIDFTSSSSANGGTFLQSTGILEKMAYLLNMDRNESNPYAKYLILSAIKFWGFFVFHRAELFMTLDSHLKVIPTFMKLAHDEDDAVVDSILIAVANMASSSKGLFYLSCEKNFLNVVVHEILPFTRGDLKLSSLRAQSCFLSHGLIAECDDVSQYIFKSIAPQPMKFLETLCLSAIPEICIAALSIVKNISVFSWGLEQISQSTSLCSFLLERRAEENVFHEWKYSILQQVLLNPRSKDIFAPSLYNRIKEFTKEGPFKSEYVPVVAYATS